MSLVTKATILDAAEMRRIVRRMAGELVEAESRLEDLMLIGIRTRGVPLAEQLAADILQLEGKRVAIGTLDITLYRDDLQTVGVGPVVGETHLPGTLDGRTVVIVDDVLYTGRTIRAALDELADFGRPKRILLCVLVDRGGRELPIQPDIAGRTVRVGPGERVDVLVSELDGRDAVELARAD